MSHTTCHILHVTYYMSHTTCHILHVIYYMSHTTCHILHVTYYMSHTTCHILHVTYYMSYTIYTYIVDVCIRGECLISSKGYHVDVINNCRISPVRGAILIFTLYTVHCTMYIDQTCVSNIK